MNEFRYLNVLRHLCILFVVGLGLITIIASNGGGGGGGETDKSKEKWNNYVTLQWAANTEPNLAGYNIYYDTNSGHPYEGYGAQEGSSPIEIDPDYDDETPDPNIVEYTIHDLPDGTYYFVVTAFNNAVPPSESYYSNEVSTTVNVD